MKTALLFLFFFVSILSYSQEVTVNKTSNSEYSFSHTKAMDQLRIDRYTSRMLAECVELDSIIFNGQECVFKLKENLSSEKTNEAIIYCISKFGYITYKIEE